ncbi:MAG: response regulator [Bacteroidales bacterium]|nr:response regulator [Bacteroidales bacterium]
MEDRTALINELNILQSIFENSPAAMMVVDKSTTIKMVNSELEKITGYGRHELEGQRKWIEMVLSEDRAILKNLLRMLKADGIGLPAKYECRFLDRHGSLKTAYLWGVFLKDSRLIILSLIDITEQKENESILKSARSKAEASDRLKTAFLGNLSHEIRTPMNAIVGFASLLQMDELTEEKKILYLTQIINGSTDLLQLIEKTISISRIDLGQIKINRRQFFVNRRLEELQEKYQQILVDAGKESIELIFEPGRNEEDFVVQADRIRILEVLNNLLENAVKFTSSGRITLGYAYLEEESDGGYDTLLFYVKDTGGGISKDKTKIIFDRFVKLVDKNETLLRGAGLGLAIAHDLVKLMGGDIWVETALGHGSKFYFTLPITYSKTQQIIAARPKSKKEYEDWSSFELLVAEDIESNYLYIKELLAPTKMNILRARDGLEAVEIFEKHPEIDLVLMDILMPGLDGYEATTKIRLIRKEVPVIAQTAFTFEGEIQDGLFAGCFTDYIMKPFTRDMLMANLKKHLASSK